MYLRVRKLPSKTSPRSADGGGTGEKYGFLTQMECYSRGESGGSRLIKHAVLELDPIFNWYLLEHSDEASQHRDLPINSGGSSYAGIHSDPYGKPLVFQTRRPLNNEIL